MACSASPFRFLHACGSRSLLYARSGLRLYLRAARASRGRFGPTQRRQGGPREISGRCCIGRELAERGEPARGLFEGTEMWRGKMGVMRAGMAGADRNRAQDARQQRAKSQIVDVVDSGSEYNPFFSTSAPRPVGLHSSALHGHHLRPGLVRLHFRLVSDRPCTLRIHACTSV